MDLTILRKRISSFKTPQGKLTKVPDELVIDILLAWEQWTGTASAFYKEIEVSDKKMASVIGKGKKLRREGRFPIDDFKEIKIDSASGQVLELSPCSGVEVIWNNGKIIRFSQVDLLIDFLNKAA